MILVLLFWVSVLLVFHSYVIFPLLLRYQSKGKKLNEDMFQLSHSQELPNVYIVFSVYNEEKVIREKLGSIFDTNYPLEKIKVIIGSDESADNSDSIIKSFSSRYPQIEFTRFTGRLGKSGVINRLMETLKPQIETYKDVLIFTDANVIFSRNTIYQLVKHFRNHEIVQVGAQIINRGIHSTGISFHEKSYIQRENEIKYLEGLNWGTMMGAFGACYALRASCRSDIPPNYLMEDFYLSMNALSKGGKAILEPKAVCYEDVSSEVGEEFKRKSRIQAGNIQNLKVFWSLLFRFDALAYCFWSHKVLRWLGPLLFAITYTCNLFLLHYPFYQFTFLLQNLLLLSPLIEKALLLINVKPQIIRFASYFVMMNIALANGVRMYWSGVKTSAWSPTKRNV